MEIGSAVYTRRTAQAVVEAIAHHINNPDLYIPLRVVEYKEGREDGEWTYWAALPGSPKNIDDFANKVEIVRCVTREGQKLDIILGQPEEREFQPALVLIHKEE